MHLPDEIHIMNSHSNHFRFYELLAENTPSRSHVFSQFHYNFQTSDSLQVALTPVSVCEQFTGKFSLKTFSPVRLL